MVGRIETICNRFRSIIALNFEKDARYSYYFIAYLKFEIERKKNEVKKSQIDFIRFLYQHSCTYFTVLLSAIDLVRYCVGEGAYVRQPVIVQIVRDEFGIVTILFHTLHYVILSYQLS